jgi:uncharacterized tellurite resistance protein B-like protein
MRSDVEPAPPGQISGPLRELRPRGFAQSAISRKHRGKPMLNALKNLFAELSAAEAATSAAAEQRQLRLAVAGLLHEMTRADMTQSPEETRTAVAAVVNMFGLPDAQAQALLDEAGLQRLTSYFDPAFIIKRLLSMEQRCALVENLWRVAFADAELDVYEDQFVRKIADLLYVSNTECMLARQRARMAMT